MKFFRKKLRKKKFDIRFIVVHTTATRPGVAIKNLDELPYHFLVTKGGKLINLKPLRAADTAIEIALSGGLDRRGKHMDTKTQQQADTLFNTLVMVTEAYPDAQIVGADQLYPYGFANPGFDVKQWLADYIPAFLLAA
jgi:N-acetylmuramoyl-L-alanine amidase